MNPAPVSNGEAIDRVDRFEHAFIYSHRAHGSQVRKGSSIPYISHLMAVAAIALEGGADEDCAIAALLHDAVEDAGGRDRLQDIRQQFGERVARIVEECSDAFESPKPPWRARKDRYIRHMRKGASSEALLVSLADKLHNARTLLLDYRRVGPQLWDRFHANREETLWYYESLLHAFRERCPGPLVEDLGRVLHDLREVSGG